MRLARTSLQVSMASKIAVSLRLPRLRVSPLAVELVTVVRECSAPIVGLHDKPVKVVLPEADGRGRCRLLDAGKDGDALLHAVAEGEDIALDGAMTSEATS